MQIVQCDCSYYHVGCSVCKGLFSLNGSAHLEVMYKDIASLISKCPTIKLYIITCLCLENLLNSNFIMCSELTGVQGSISSIIISLKKISDFTKAFMFTHIPGRTVHLEGWGK